LDNNKEEVEDPQIKSCTIISKKSILALEKLCKYIETYEGMEYVYK